MEKGEKIMPINNHVGYGSTTEDKQQGLKDIISQQLSIIKTIDKKYKTQACYRIIDCCSGPGENPPAISIREGSPLILINAAEYYKVRYTGHFIERESIEFNQLCRTLEKIRPTLKYGKVEAIFGNWEDELFKTVNDFTSFLKSKDKRYWQFGIAYWDPNSYPDMDTIGQFTKHSSTKYIDVVIHLSATSLKRRNGAAPHLSVLLDEYINKMSGKTEWFIRDVLPGDQHQMTFLFGTNYQRYTAMNSKRFYDIHSSMGQRIVEKLSLSKIDYMKTPLSREGLDGWGIT